MPRRSRATRMPKAVRDLFVEWGRQGGKARLEKISPERRREIAKHASDVARAKSGHLPLPRRREALDSGLSVRHSPPTMIGDELRAQRRRLGLTQEQLAVQLGV